MQAPALHGNRQSSEAVNARCHIYQSPQISKPAAWGRDGGLRGGEGRDTAARPRLTALPAGSKRRAGPAGHSAGLPKAACAGALGREAAPEGRRRAPPGGGARRRRGSPRRSPRAPRGAQRGAAAALHTVPRRRGSCGQGGAAAAGPVAAAWCRGAAAEPSARGRTERAARRNSSLRHV